MLRSIFLVFVTHVEGLHAIKISSQTSAQDVEGIHAIEISNQTSAQGHKKAIVGCPAAANPGHGIAYNNAFGNDFDVCMINRWTGNAAAGVPVLRTSPTASCSSNDHTRLCYGLPARRPNNAQFISCYNTATLIPKFTAYVVSQGPGIDRPKVKFRRDNGPCAPYPQARPGDCSRPPNATDPYFCSRGHLAPSGAFNTQEEARLTFIMTNVAPQWQAFNGGNWAAVERAVKNYANDTGHDVYVFTGTAGKTKYWQYGWRWTFRTSSRGPVAPRYFWKAVCDPHPGVQQSIFFIAKNNVNDQSQLVVTSASCFNKNMRHDRGVIECESISQAASIRRRLWNWWHGLAVPDFHPGNCNTATKGNFLQPYLNFYI